LAVAVPAVRSAKLAAPSERAREAIQDRPSAVIGLGTPLGGGRRFESLQSLRTLPAFGQVVQYAFPAIPGYGASRRRGSGLPCPERDHQR
jgi:hypothetical protein